MNRKLLVAGFMAFFILGCSSGGDVKKQSYATYGNSKFFEHEYPRVWKGILAALGEMKLEEKDQEDGKIKTNWVFSTSNDKFVEYQVNGFPRKHYLQTRYRFEIIAEKKLGGVKITIDTDEEVEKLKSDGSFDDWKSSDVDTSRAHELLEKIETKILALPI